MEGVASTPNIAVRRVIIGSSPVGQVPSKRSFPVEEMRHRGDAPHIPPDNVTILGSGDGRLRHPLVHGSLDVVISDSGQTCGKWGLWEAPVKVLGTTTTTSSLGIVCSISPVTRVTKKSSPSPGQDTSHDVVGVALLWVLRSNAVVAEGLAKAQPSLAHCSAVLGLQLYWRALTTKS